MGVWFFSTLPTQVTGIPRVGVIWGEVKDYIRNKLRYNHHE